MVVPFLFISTKKSHKDLLNSVSTPAVGSSNISNSGILTKAFATISLRFIPPDKFLPCSFLLSQRSNLLRKYSEFFFISEKGSPKNPA